MSHTPGPWKLNNGASVTYRHKASEHPIASTHRPRPFELGDQSEEQLANARLISASPDLLKAVNDLLIWTEALAIVGSPSPEAWDKLIKIQDRAQKAINKAIGA